MARLSYCEIGIYHPKTPLNIGTLWRSAYQLGAAGIFTIGRRYHQQASDTLKTWRHIPLREYPDFAAFQAAQPFQSLIVGIEMGGKALATYFHPARAIYLLGAEDHGLPPDILALCHEVVSIEAMRTASYNVAVAGSLVLYHRMVMSANTCL